jgi:hypothetical protein
MILSLNVVSNHSQTSDKNNAPLSSGASVNNPTLMSENSPEKSPQAKKN